MKDKKELKSFQKYLKKWSVSILQINDTISIKAMFLVENYFLSSSLQLGDALIASTVLENQEMILTGNDRHYKFIPNLQIQKFKP